MKPATDGQQFRYYFRTGGASGSDITAYYSFSKFIHLVLFSLWNWVWLSI